VEGQGRLGTKQLRCAGRRRALPADLAVPTFTNKRLLRNSAFLLQVVAAPKVKRNILRFGPADFEFRNSLNNVKVGQPPAMQLLIRFLACDVCFDLFSLCVV
jgi:hypothetical protein